MACSQTHWIALIGLWIAAILPQCWALTIDQMISRSVTSPKGYGFMYDEASRMVRVDMDMIFSIEDWTRYTRQTDQHSGTHKRQAIRNGAGGNYWPGGIIHYEIDENDFNEREVQMIKQAMEEWMQYTCVKFRPADKYTRHKVRFLSGNGCSSNVGMVKDNVVTLSKRCRARGVVMHELGHVLGFHHEQTRPDRDNYVRILRQNIPDHLEYNFRKYTWGFIRDLDVPYDYLSIMHYGKDAFSYNGQTTIETLDEEYQDLIGNRIGLSFRDVKSANILYNCKPSSDDCNLTDDDCPGEGFVSINCSCWCPSPDMYSQRPYYVCHPGQEVPKPQLFRPSRGSSYYSGIHGGRAKCEDQNKNCQMWAAHGECSKNRFYMGAYCKKACGLCNKEAKKCRDMYAECGFWREKGHCDPASDFKVFMSTNCRKSCDLCPSTADKKVPLCERQCRDDHKHCQMWALRGECRGTPDYMLRYCRKACNTCCSTTTRRSRSRARSRSHPSKPADLQGHERGTEQGHGHATDQTYAHGTERVHRQHHRHGTEWGHKRGHAHGTKLGHRQGHGHGTEQGHRQIRGHGTKRDHRHRTEWGHRQGHRHETEQSHRHGHRQGHGHDTGQGHRQGHIQGTEQVPECGGQAPYV